MGESLNTHGRAEKCIQNLVGKLKGKKIFLRPGSKWDSASKIS
jgi:hypothetical protein